MIVFTDFEYLNDRLSVIIALFLFLVNEERIIVSRLKSNFEHVYCTRDIYTRKMMVHQTTIAISYNLQKLCNE